jgi:hypothetical protein
MDCSFFIPRANRPTSSMFYHRESFPLSKNHWTLMPILLLLLLLLLLASHFDEVLPPSNQKSCIQQKPAASLTAASASTHISHRGSIVNAEKVITTVMTTKHH